MNRIFSPDGEGWPGFPRVSYGRLDQVEPINLEAAKKAVFAFDVIDARWRGIGEAGAFGFDKSRGANQTQYWSRLFAGDIPSEDAFADAPIYRVEITLRREDRDFARFSQLDPGTWVQVHLQEKGTVGVDVFGGLFAQPVSAFLSKLTPVPALSLNLSAIFDMETWPDASQREIEQAVGGLPAIETLLTYDVGQGSANAFADSGESALLFFDLGCGVYRNKFTRPAPLRFCWRENPSVLMSHWDADHWAGANNDPFALQATWIVPRQKIGPTHATFANRVLQAGGKILVWGDSPTSITLPAGSSQRVKLARCNGTDRNGSGIACLVKDSRSARSWLLTGDAGYHQLPFQPLPTNLSALVVPHHGADMGPRSTPPARPNGYARLIYSFGPGNLHGRTTIQHPTPTAIAAHTAQGWVDQPPASGGDRLETANHPLTHKNGIAASWVAAPSVPFTTLPCAATRASNQGCTNAIAQA